MRYQALDESYEIILIKLMMWEDTISWTGMLVGL